MDFEMATFWDALLTRFDFVDFDKETRLHPEKYLIDTDIWRLLAISNETYNGQAGVRFVFHYQRKAETYYTNLFLPMAQLNVLQICVFLMPADSSDRPGFSITVFLASSVLLNMFENNLPMTAELLYMQVNFGIQISIGVVITVWILFSNRLCHNKKFQSKVRFCHFSIRKIDFIDAILFFLSIFAYVLVNIVTFSLLTS